MFMKKYAPKYSDDRIVYWPSFVGGVGTLCYCAFILLLYLAILVLTWGGGHGTRCAVAIVAVLLLAWLVVFLRITIRAMFCCIEITRKGFLVTNKITGTNTHTLWEDVSRIEFKQETYRGRKQYRVYLKNTVPEQHIAIPVCMVEEDKLRSFLPVELLINKPYSF